METSSDVSLSEPNIAPEAELARLVQALTILPSQQRETLLRILSTAPSLEGLQTDLVDHPELQIALEHCSLATPESPKYKQEVDQLAPFAPANLSVSFQHAIAATVQYRWTNNEHLLQDAITSWEYIFHHTDFSDAGLEFRQMALNNGGITFQLYYLSQGSIEDWSRAQGLFEQVLMLTPLDSEKRAVPLCNLGLGLLERYQHTEEFAYLEQGIQYLEEAVLLVTFSSPRRTICLLNLGLGLNNRYKYTQQLADLERSTQILYEALESIPPISPNRSSCLRILGNGLLQRFFHARSFEDLEQGLKHLQEALNLSPSNSLERSLCLMEIGNGLKGRYSHSGQLADFEQAIRYYLEALKLFSPKAPLKVRCLEALANMVLERYDETGEQSDLEQALQWYHQSLSLAPIDSELRVSILISLSRGLYRLHGQKEQITDLEQSIHLLQEAFSLISPRSHNRAYLLNTLGIVLSQRYELTREQADLDKAFRYYNQALSLEPSNWHIRANILTNLAHVLHTQYTLTGKMNDLEQAIQYWQRIVDEASIRESRRAIYLTSLALGLHERYGSTKDLKDLDQAIDLYNQALTITLPESPGHAAYLTNLGNMWLSRYEYTGNLTDLKQALNALYQAVEETPYESLSRALNLINLGEGLYRYYQYTGEKEHLKYTSAAWDEAWFFLRTNFVTLPVSYKVGQQKRWFDLYTGLISIHLLLASVERSTAAISRQRALEVVEGSKSVLLTQLVNRSILPNPVGIPSEMITREQVLLTELTALDNTELVTYGRTILSEENIDRTRELHNRQAYLQELEHLWATISKISPEGSDYVALRRGNTSTWADFKRLANKLGQNTALLSFFVTVRRWRLFLVRKGWRSPHVVDILLPENKWADLLLRFSHEIPGSVGSNRRGETWDQPLQALLKLASQHLVGVDRLVLAPQGAGHLLPWNVVVQRAGYRTTEGQYLPQVTLPALGLLTRLRQRPRSLDGLTLVIGNPRGDLPFAEQEAQSVATQFGITPLLGSQATKTAVLAQLEQASLIHLATHAFFVPGTPLEAAIELADGELTAREVLQLRLQADLLVLSGCETGKAESLGGEELAGLAQAFLQAGVRSLIVSLWPVNDFASAALMMAFYQARQAGADKALALRQAMTIIQQDPRWHHPYYWGAFVLMGDWE